MRDVVLNLARRRGAVSVAAAVVIGLLAVAIARSPTDEPRAIEPSTPVVASPSPSPSASVLGQTFDRPATIETPRSRAPEPSVERAPAAPSCRRSTEPRCGELYWEPAPGPNRPLVLELSIEPSEPRAGEPVIFTVFARDRDARPRCCDVAYDGKSERAVVVDCFDQRTGAWPPPRRTGASRTFTFEHIFEDAGTHRAEFHARSGPACRTSPYANSASIEAEFVVWPAPTPAES